MSFAEFFQSVHGREPFPWQAEAARRLLAGERLESITVPTGCGKTALIDAAVYHAAHGGPRRIFFIIDRRVVVDEAYERSERIRAALLAGSTALLRDLAQRLGKLQLLRLRGGVQMDGEWVFQPEAVTVAVSTVDQVGSRLLHRGYGVSARMWPVHAGFVGNHALYLLDEAHLSRPFAATVRSAIAHGADIRLIELSATPEQAGHESLGLSDMDLRTPAIEKRLKACKWTSLETAPDNDAQFAALAAEKAKRLAVPGTVIGMVVNRVRSARQIWQYLKREGLDAHLLIGRIRPHDRDRLLARLMPRIRTGRERGNGDPLFIVATQTIEVGADLDFDALVTEAASLSALRQRFGRLDRLGERGESKGAILGREKQLTEEGAAAAPIYGADLRNAWEWLAQSAQDSGNLADFGLLSMTRAMAEHPPAPERPAHAPALLPAHIDLLTQTGLDAPQLDPAPWLHGPQRRSNEVSVVWRADLQPMHDRAIWEERVQLMPPRTAEALSLPIAALRDLLLGKGRSDAGDVEGGDEGHAAGETTVRPFVRWRGPDECEVLARLDVRPGDTVVLPAFYGGCDEYGWAPESDAAVTDIAEACLAASGKPFSLRLIPGLWAGDDANKLLGSDTLVDAVKALRKRLTDSPPEEGVDEEAVNTAWHVLKNMIETMDHPYARRLGARFDYSLLQGDGILLSQPRLEEFGGGTSTGIAVPLDSHLEGVAAMAATLSGDDPDAPSVIVAARKHDLGKQAPAFQAMLYGDPFHAAAGQPLAKSGLHGRKAREAARRWLPKGFRHELYSVELADTGDALVDHLIGTHHGHGRPWFPPCANPQGYGAHQIALNANWASRFAQVRAEKGPWRLAELELLLRAADIRRSQDECTQSAKGDA